MSPSHVPLLTVSTYFQSISALVICVLLLQRVDAQNRRDEVRALLNFRTNVKVVAVHYWSTWNANAENPCNWTGVLCTKNFTVAELDISGWGLGPYSLEDLSGLRDLRHLDMSSMDFTDHWFPLGIENLTGLVLLDISGTQVRGSILGSISNCTSLRYISLERNKLSGEIPSLRGLVNLKTLNLSDNLLTGQFPKDLQELSSLVSLDLSQNMLNGSIPSLSKLTNLVELRLDDNNFTKFEESWLPPPNLQYLSISGNLLDGIIPPSISNLSTLISLDMSRNQFSSVPFGFSKLLNLQLKTLDLSQNQLSGNILENVLPDSTETLSSVNLSHNNLTGVIPLDGDKVNVYYAFDLSHNQLSGPMPYFFSNDSSYIFFLRLQHNKLSGDIVDVLNHHGAMMDQTVELRLENNLFSGDLSRMAFPRCSDYTLRSVDLSNNNLQMTTTETNLDPLRATLECFMQAGWPLQEFRMAGNNFSGILLPTHFNHTNQLIQDLEILDLSNNHLTGIIPGTAFDGTLFSSLQHLNLSNNDLSGPIPKNAVDLPSLAVFDVANNRLQGPLPTIPPSSRLYNPSFFAGNAGLCGEPLTPCKEDSRRGIQWWLIGITIAGSMIVAIGSCLFATWRWRVYHKKHQQDADLIRTLINRESATVMALRDLKKATHNFAETAQIGEGGFGTVYIGKLSDGKRVAIKRSKREGSEKDKEQFLNEVRILSQINHRYLVKLLGCCMENQVALLVFEFISNGTLQQHLQGKFGDVCLSWDKRLNIAIQTAEALNYLHSGATFPIYHRDVKSANILLNEHFHAKVADFGISRLAPVEATHVSTIAVQGTIGYIDPEYYTTYQLNDKSDVYSFGVVLLELISAKPPIDFLRGGDDTSLVNFAKSYIERRDLQNFIDGALLETYVDPTGTGKESILNVGLLAMKCLDMQSKARPTMKDVLKELQHFRIERNGQSKESGSINEYDIDEASFLSSSTTNSSRFVRRNSGSGTEMSQYSSHSGR